MKKEDIHIVDWHRILFGDAPAAFLAETLLRSIIIYLTLLAVARLLGKRMKGQLTITEMAVMLMIGAIASVGMQVPDRGVLQGLLLLALILCLQRGITRLEIRSRQLERLTQGKAILLVKDGILQLRNIERAPITRQEVFAALRTRNVPHLGRVDRVYFEACGIISVYQNTSTEIAGLSVWPETDKALKLEEQRAPDALQACTNCGHTQHAAPLQACSNCGKADWTKAVVSS